MRIDRHALSLTSPKGRGSGAVPGLSFGRFLHLYLQPSVVQRGGPRRTGAALDGAGTGRTARSHSSVVRRLRGRGPRGGAADGQVLVKDQRAQRTTEGECVILVVVKWI